jgi:hypothetical protein
MQRIVLIVSLLLASTTADAQRVCKRGIPCGNTCIAANRTCRVGPGKAAGAPQGAAGTAMVGGAGCTPASGAGAGAASLKL